MCQKHLQEPMSFMTTVELKHFIRNGAGHWPVVCLMCNISPRILPVSPLTWARRGGGRHRRQRPRHQRERGQRGGGGGGLPDRHPGRHGAATVSTSRLSTLTFLNFLKIFLSKVNIFLYSKYFCLHIYFHVLSPAPGRQGTMINTIWQLACHNAGPRRIKFYISS